MKKTNWKVYFTLLIIFIPLVIATIFILPNNCIYFIYIYLILFWIIYYILNHREKSRKDDWYNLYNKEGILLKKLTKKLSITLIASLVFMYYIFTAIVWSQFLIFGIFSANYPIAISYTLIAISLICFIIIIPICIIWTSIILIKNLK